MYNFIESHSHKTIILRLGNKLFSLIKSDSNNIGSMSVISISKGTKVTSNRFEELYSESQCDGDVMTL